MKNRRYGVQVLKGGNGHYCYARETGVGEGGLRAAQEQVELLTSNGMDSRVVYSDWIAYDPAQRARDERLNKMAHRLFNQDAVDLSAEEMATVETEVDHAGH